MSPPAPSQLHAPPVYVPVILVLVAWPTQESVTRQVMTVPASAPVPMVTIVVGRLNVTVLPSVVPVMLPDTVPVEVMINPGLVIGVKICVPVIVVPVCVMKNAGAVPSSQVPVSARVTGATGAVGVVIVVVVVVVLGAAGELLPHAVEANAMTVPTKRPRKVIGQYGAIPVVKTSGRFKEVANAA